MPYEALQIWLNEKYPELKVDIEKHIVPRMKDLIIDSVLSVKDTMNPLHKKNCFEIFGYDFLIDEDFRVWLLEVNSNPYLGILNDFIENLMPRMMNELLQKTVDLIYPPKIQFLKSNQITTN